MTPKKLVRTTTTTTARLDLALAALLGVSIAAACGPTQKTEPRTAEGEPATTEAPKAPETPFDEMSPGARLDYMKKTVAPHMADVFQELAPEEYADFGCPTCHGPGARDGNFAMPTESLPPLDEEEMAAHPEITQFMKERVVPAMATLLGEKPYDATTGEGFGCFDCHTKKE